MVGTIQSVESKHKQRLGGHGMQRIDSGQHSDNVTAWGYADVTVGFVDIVNFTHLCAELTPLSVVSLLDDFFFQLDEFAAHHRLKFIKTIGDAYMLASGLAHDEEGSHTERMLAFAKDVLALAQTHPDVLDTPFEVRIGLATGPVVAGVLRCNSMQVDLWGDTVNLASRLCAKAEPMGLAMEEMTYLSLPEEVKAGIAPQSEPVQIKGRGEMKIYRYSLS